jgi:hypothetical protein
MDIEHSAGHSRSLCDFCHCPLPPEGGIPLVTPQNGRWHRPTVRVACGEACAAGVTASLTAGPVRRLDWAVFVRDLCGERGES